MRLAYIDSSVWITRFEGIPIYKDRVSSYLYEMTRENWTLCISEVVLLEIMVKPYRNQNIAIIDTYNKFFEQLKLLKNYPDLFKDALTIAQTEHLHNMDAIHIAMATHYGCQQFISTDSHFRNIKIIPITLINLSEL